MLNMIDDVCPMQLRANDFDWGGHLNNSVYFQLFEYGRWSWANKNGIDLAHTSVIAVVVSANVDFLKSVAWNPLGSVEVGTSLRRIETFSIYLNQKVSQKEIVCADATIRLSLLDINSNSIKKIDMEALKREIISQ